jgi:methylmalonyl-CoA mutase
MATDNLLKEFPPVSTQTWEEVIHKDLKGADYAKRLIWQTEEGLAVKPYYRSEDTAGLEYPLAAPGDFPYARSNRSNGDWRIREEIDAIDPEEANRAAVTAVVAGAEQIAFRKVAIANGSDLSLLLANLQEIPLHFENADEPLLRLLMARLAKGLATPPISTGWNPLSNLDFAAEVLRSASPAFVPFTISGEAFEAAGATAVEEIGFTLAAGVDFLAEMQSRKVAIDSAATGIEFSFPIGTNFFFQIGKLRAFRMLWARAVDSFGGSHASAKARIHARTSRWGETIYDPHVNVLRGTTEAFSAIMGSADAITVAPFDECYKTPDDASRRLARNTQLLLKQESLLARVADPGAGSYTLESITDFLAQEGWKTLQQVEAAGGFGKAQDLVKQTLAKSSAAKQKAVIARRRIFTGTNQVANLTEKALDRIDASLVMNEQRGTWVYEQLRLRTERSAAKTGKTPRILLAEIGDVKMRSARSNFAANFFGCAGFDIVTTPFENVDGIMAADAAVIVLCSSDPQYPELVAETMAKLKALGRKTPVVVAGYPESAEQLTAAGVADFVHVKSNPIEVLAKWQKQLGIED